MACGGVIITRVINGGVDGVQMEDKAFREQVALTVITMARTVVIKQWNQLDSFYHSEKYIQEKENKATEIQEKKHMENQNTSTTAVKSPLFQ